MRQGGDRIGHYANDGWTALIQGASFWAHFGRTGASPMPTAHRPENLGLLGLATKF